MKQCDRVSFAVVWWVGVTLLLGLAGVVTAEGKDSGKPEKGAEPLFVDSSRCLACHNNLKAEDGQDHSFGSDWQGSMMAHSAKDPYWQAAVRREVLDHPTAAAAIENECAKCHMPMDSFQTRAEGGRGEVFANLKKPKSAPLALDGVSCTLCHQIQRDHLGEETSFGGGFVIDTTLPMEERPLFGPYKMDSGRATTMHSATGFVPAQTDHLATSEFCATCHTLITHTLNDAGEVIGELPEQVPYLEWKHSAFAETATLQHCQDCHLPEVSGEAPISRVLAVPREKVSRHVFRGGNFFMLRMLAKYQKELQVTAPPEVLTQTAERTVEYLSTASSRVSVESVEEGGGSLAVTVAVRNLAGHKLPTAYPSRRAWLHVTVRDGKGAVVFESGALQPDGSIAGNDNDADAAGHEPHYVEITRPDQVQIYETILVDPNGAVTTGLLTALSYAKDNRLLPTGFDKETAEERIAVHGVAKKDDDFTEGGDRILYRIDPGEAGGPFTVEAELLYQPISFRWARNLEAVDAPEPRRFTKYYREMADESAVVLARDSGRGEETPAGR